MIRHHHPRYRLPQMVVECLRDLKAIVHLWRPDRARRHLIHPALTQIKMLATSGESVKSRLRRPLGDTVNDRSQGVTKKIILDAALRNFARSDVYSVYRLGSPWTSSVQT
jgi:hypothetical protein